ncbi:hypothetical protein ACLBSQ_27315, partial [Klebsiella pneumoniae]
LRMNMMISYQELVRTFPKSVQKLLFEWFPPRLRYAKSEENRRGEYVRFHVARGNVKENIRMISVRLMGQY